MDLKIKNEKENAFFKRKELEVEISHPNSTTPAKTVVLKEIATKYSVPEEHVIIDYIFTKKGICESFAKIKVYEEKPKMKIKKEKTEEKPKEVEKSEAQASEAK